MIDESEAFAPITQLRFSLIVICLFSIVIIAVLALYLARIFTEPITRLARASRLIGEGDFTATTDVHSHDEIGALAGSISQMRDSLRSFVASIQSQRNQLAIVLDSTTDSILSVDHNGLITTANQALLELTNLPATSIIGHPFHEILHLVTEDAGTLQIDYRGTGTASYQNVEFESNSHFKHYLRVIVAHLEGSAESPKQSIITIRDETKSRELESMKLDFVSMAAHELRTPLAAIRGYIELINFDLKRSKPEIKKYLKQAMTSSAELSALINNLLDVSRIERGTLTLNVVKTDFAASASRAVHDVGFQAVERSIKLNYTGPSNGYFIAADEIAMREVITNLLTNAIKYTEPGGKVDVTLEPSGDVYKFTVKDTGIGIPASAIPHLFTKFFRVHAGLASGSNGTGLGLFIAKSIVERHEGTISVQSEPGKGSAFSVTIPKLNDDRLAQIEAKAQAELQTVRRHRGWVTKNTAR